MKKILTLVFDAINAARTKQAREHLMQHLDERTLRDIGLEHEANRARERRRMAISFGAY